MNRYRITNRLSGFDLGVFPGDTEAEAIEAMERDAGYADVAQVNAALDSTPGERRAELTVTEVCGNIDIGCRVTCTDEYEAGLTEEDRGDSGTVLELYEDRALVGWDSGDRTWIDCRDLEVL